MDEQFDGTLDGGSDYPRWESGGGVRFKHVQQTVTSPHNVEWLKYRGMVTRLFVRRVHRPTGGYVSHVVCDEVGDVLRVASAIKLYEDVFPGIENANPLDMLTVFVQTLKMPPIFLCGEAFQILAMHSFDLKKQGVFEIGIGEQKGDIQTVSHYALSADKKQLHVNHGWAMNFTTYREYLAAHD